MSQDPELSDQDEGVYRVLDLSDEEMERRAAAQELSREQANEWGAQCNYRARQLSAENEQLRSRLGIEPGAPIGGTESELHADSEAQNGNVDHTSPYIGGSSNPVNDLVTEAPRVSRDELEDMIREVVKELLPRQRGVPTRIPGEEIVGVPAAEVIERTYGAVALGLQRLLARQYSVSQEAAFFAAGVSEPVCALLESLVSAAPRRPIQSTHSVSLP